MYCSARSADTERRLAQASRLSVSTDLAGAIMDRDGIPKQIFSRISYRVPDMYIPTDEEIWAD